MPQSIPDLGTIFCFPQIIFISIVPSFSFLTITVPSWIRTFLNMRLVMVPCSNVSNLPQGVLIWKHIEAMIGNRIAGINKFRFPWQTIQGKALTKMICSAGYDSTNEKSVQGINWWSIDSLVYPFKSALDWKYTEIHCPLRMKEVVLIRWEIR